MCTVHAPHSCIPQPNFVPVMPSVSRNTQSRGICGTTSTVCCFPFRVNLTAAMSLLNSLPCIVVRNFDTAFPETLVVLFAGVLHDFPVCPQRKRPYVFPF